MNPNEQPTRRLVRPEPGERDLIEWVNTDSAVERRATANGSSTVLAVVRTRTVPPVTA